MRIYLLSQVTEFCHQKPSYFHILTKLPTYFNISIYIIYLEEYINIIYRYILIYAYIYINIYIAITFLIFWYHETSKHVAISKGMPRTTPNSIKKSYRSTISLCTLTALDTHFFSSMRAIITIISSVIQRRKWMRSSLQIAFETRRKSTSLQNFIKFAAKINRRSFLNSLRNFSNKSGIGKSS